MNKVYFLLLISSFCSLPTLLQAQGIQLPQFTESDFETKSQLTITAPQSGHPLVLEFTTKQNNQPYLSGIIDQSKSLTLEGYEKDPLSLDGMIELFIPNDMVQDFYLTGGFYFATVYHFPFHAQILNLLYIFLAPELYQWRETYLEPTDSLRNCLKDFRDGKTNTCKISTTDALTQLEQLLTMEKVQHTESTHELIIGMCSYIYAQTSLLGLAASTYLTMEAITNLRQR